MNNSGTLENPLVHYKGDTELGLEKTNLVIHESYKLFINSNEDLYLVMHGDYVFALANTIGDWTNPYCFCGTDNFKSITHKNVVGTLYAFEFTDYNNYTMTLHYTLING